jgi:outer membrane immunogenic protein
MGQAVFGLEGDIDWSGVRGSTANVPCTTSCETRNDWLATARDRIGYAFGNFMPYVTGGAAFGNVKFSPADFAGDSETRTGWTLGGGIEARIAGPWTAKIEYLYADLGKANCAAGLCAVATSADLTANILRAGVFHF